MKKIIATVLAMVMALALCTTAFAATTYTDGKAYKLDAGKNVTDTVKDVEFKAADKDAKTVAYYEIDGGKYIFSDKAVANSYAIKTASGWVYLKTVTDVTYYAVGSEYAKTVKASDAKCGEFGADKAGLTVYSYVSGDDTYYAIEAAEGVAAQTNLLVGDKLVGVVAISKNATHKWVNTFDTDKVTLKSRVCDNCKKAEEVISYNEYVLLKDEARDSEGTIYFKVVAAGSTSTTTGTTTSPKTFDAGIAMYVGMALTSVAGSAVVIGKKKEF